MIKHFAKLSPILLKLMLKLHSILMELSLTINLDKIIHKYAMLVNMVQKNAAPLIHQNMSNGWLEYLLTNPLITDFILKNVKLLV